MCTLRVLLPQTALAMRTFAAELPTSLTADTLARGMGWRLQSARESWSVDFSVVRSPTTTVVTDRQYFRNGVQKRQVVESRGLFMTDCGHEPSPVLGLEAGEAPHHTML